MVSSSFSFKQIAFTVLFSVLLSACGGGDDGPSSTPTPTPPPTPDTVPDAYSYTDVTDAELATQASSDVITISGIDTAVDVTISDGAGRFAIAGGSFGTEGSITNNQSLQVQVDTSAEFSTPSSITLNIGGITSTFTATTYAQDLAPEAYSFASQAGLARNDTATSNTVTITGINDEVDVLIHEGQGSFSVEGGSFDTTGVISNGQTLQVQVPTQSGFAAASTITLDIGGVRGSFTATTLEQDLRPEPFSFVNVTDATVESDVTSAEVTITGINDTAEVSIVQGTGTLIIDGETVTGTSGNINNDGTLQVQLQASSDFSSDASVRVYIGGEEATFTVTTEARDVIPNEFSFTNQTGLGLSAAATSAAVTIEGINDGAPVSITAGSGSLIIAGADQGTSGTIQNGQTLQVSTTTSPSFSTGTTVSVNVGGDSGVTQSFSATTEARDILPEAFTFTDQTDVAIETEILSAAVTIMGINDATAVTLTGDGELVIAGSNVGTSSTITNGQTLQVSMTTGSAFETGMTANVNVGGDDGVTRSFTATTAAQDLTPDVYSFTTVSDADPNTNYTSEAETIAGITGSVAISLSSASSNVWYSVNSDQDADFTQAASEIEADDVVRVRVRSAATPGTDVVATLTIGTEASDFTVTTAADTTPPESTVAFPTPVTLTDGNTLTVRGSASDDFGPVTSINLVVTDSTDAVVDDVTINVSGDEDYTEGWSAQVDLGSDTVNTVTIRATDDAGNQETTATVLSVTHSSTAINFPVGEDVSTGTVSGREIGLDASDPDAHRLILPRGAGAGRGFLSVDVNSGNREVIITDDSTIESNNSLLTQSGSSQFYFTEQQSTAPAIYLSDENGGGYTEITSLSNTDSDVDIGTPIGMALHSGNGLLYVADGTERAIYSVDVTDDGDGIGRRTLVSGDARPDGGANVFEEPSDLILDEQNGRALVVEEIATPRLMWVNLSTGERTVAGNATGLTSPYFIEKYSDDRAILVDWGTSQVLWVDLTNDGALSVISDNSTPSGGANLFSGFAADALIRAFSVAVDVNADIAYVLTSHLFAPGSSVKVVDLTTGERIILSHSLD